MDDHTVGETIGSGTLSGHYGAGLNFAVELSEPVQYARFSNLGICLQLINMDLTVRHSQFVNCLTACEHTGTWLCPQFILENVLFYTIGTVRNGEGNLTAKHLTIHQCTNFMTAENLNSGTIANSIIAGLSDWGSIAPGKINCYEGTDSGIFQTVGAGAHYLAANNPYRNAGTASDFSADLLADLKKRTTYPPIVLAGLGWYTNDVTLSPQAQRDTDTPDLVYHYDPLDFAITGLALTNADLTLLPGTAVATYAPSSTYSVILYPGSQLVSEGSPTNLNRIVRYNTVQEQANTNWTHRVTSVITYSETGSGAISLRSRFTEWSVPAMDTCHFYGWNSTSGSLSFTDSQFHGGTFESDHPAVAFTNCLLNRVNTYFENWGDYEDFAVHVHKGVSPKWRLKGSQMALR